MNISPVLSFKSDYGYKPNFTSCTKIYNPQKITNLDIFCKDKIMTTSNLFRYDQDWNRLMKYIFWNFVNEKKISICSFACSDGSEPLSYALYLHNKMPKSFYSKYIPIIASDIDPEMIKIAKSGKINLSKYDFENMDKYIKNANLYFTPKGEPIKISNNIYEHEKSYAIDPDIMEMMTFKKSDMLTEVKQLKEDENYIVNIRNVFPYLKQNYRDEVLKTLSQKLKSGNIFVYGHYDYLVPNFKQKLFDLGFFAPYPDANFVQKL